MTSLNCSMTLPRAVIGSTRKQQRRSRIWTARASIGLLTDERLPLNCAIATITRIKNPTERGLHCGAIIRGTAERFLQALSGLQCKLWLRHGLANRVQQLDHFGD